jgi:uncharacterized protein (DUF433 family)/DNA-binding transcriptional MerR regulator
MESALVSLSASRPFSGSFYTISEAARILQIENARKVRDWAIGSEKVPPVITRQYPESDNELGFWDLLEVRFIKHFRKHNVSLQHIRQVARIARERLQSAHPFALSSTKFVTDRKKIFMEVAKSEHDKDLEELVSGQKNMHAIIEQSLAKGIEFDPQTGLAKRWHPDPKKFSNIVLDPKIAHGRPSINGIPTEALFLNYKAEGFDIEAVSDWFEIQNEFVEEAVEYEMDLGGEVNR